MNLCDRNEIQELLRRHGFRFSKSMGQNFLIELYLGIMSGICTAFIHIAAGQIHKSGRYLFCHKCEDRRAGDRSRHRPPDPAAGPAGGEGSLRGAGSSALSRAAGDYGGL